MKITLFAAATIGALGLTACSPAADDSDTATSADTAGADASTMAPAGAPMSSSTTAPGAAGTTAWAPAGQMGMSGSDGTMNPDGSMSNGAANPGSPPPTTTPDSMGSTGSSTPPAQ